MNIVKRQGTMNTILIYLGIGIGVVNTFLRAKAITAEQIGLISTLTTLAGMIEFFINFGLPPAITRFYALFRERIKVKSSYVVFVLVIQIALLAIGCLVTVLFRRSFVSFYDNNSLLDRYFLFIVYYIIGDVLAIVFKQIVEAELKSVYANVASDFSWRVVNLLFLAGMMVLPIGFEAYFYFTIFSVFVRFLLLLVPVIPRVDLGEVRFGFATKEFRRDFVQYCLFTTFAGAAGLVNASIDKLMIGYYLDLEAVGVYTIARSLSAVVRAPGTGFARIAAPVIARHWANNETKEIERLYRESTSMQLFVGGIVFALLASLALPMLRVVGEAYVKGHLAILFLAAGQLVNIGTGFCGTIIAYSKRYKFDLVCQAILVVLTVVNNILLTPRLGITGAALGTAISLAVYNIVKLVFVRVKFGMMPYDRQTLKVISAVAIVGLGLYGLTEVVAIEGILPIIAAGIAALVVYLALSIWVFRIHFVVEAAAKLLDSIRRRLGGKASS